MAFRNLTIKQLQAAAQDEIARRARAGKMSRSARLYLVHRLSQTAQGGLWALLLVAIAAAAALLPAHGARAVVWAALTLTAFAASLRLLKQYQLGAVSSGRPFQWRANYSASLVVLGAAFGSGAMLLAPADETAARLWIVYGVLGFGATIAAIAHRAYFQAASAILAPVALFCAVSALRAGAPLAMAAASIAAGVIAAGALALTYRRQLERAMRLHPVDPYLQAFGSPDAFDDNALGEAREGEASDKSAA
ncbi:MAG: hypothetical protein Tsb0010_15630 [Parvularculaceae bacterium]